MFLNRKTRRADRVRNARPAYRPSLEGFERRELLAVMAQPFLQGTVFVDTGTAGVESTTEKGLPGATVFLENLAGTKLATATTDANGNYSFVSGSALPGGQTLTLVPGTTYQLVESTASYTSTGSSALSEIDTVPSTTASTIQVTVVDPNKVIDTVAGPGTYGNPPYDSIGYSLNGVVAQYPEFTTQIISNLSGTAGVNTATFNSLCVNISDPLSANVPFGSTIDSQSAVSNGGRIAYIFNHYGTALPAVASLPAGLSSISTKNLVAGAQLAIWELEYGSALQLVPGKNDPAYTSAQDYADLQTAAAAFIADSVGKSEDVAIIDASKSGVVPTPSVTPGAQSVLATESFNFGVKPTIPPLVIGGTAYNDHCGTGLSNTSSGINQPFSGSTGDSGVTINLINPVNNAIVATTTTANDGSYSFNNVASGTYTVSETVPGGLVETGPALGSYTVTVNPTTPTSTSDNFANFTPVNASTIAGITYTVNGKQVSDLRGMTSPGAVVTVSFTNTSTNSVTLSLVGYTAPASSFSASTASQQQIVALQTGSYGYGPHTLTITLPNSYYQVDFVAGCPIYTFGPAGSNVFYGQEGRLIGADNGGAQAYATSSLSGTVYADANGNDSFGAGDAPIANDTVTLTGTTSAGVAVPSTTTATNSAGFYSFPGLAPGVYTVVATTPAGDMAEAGDVGSAGGTSGTGSVSAVALNSNTAAVGYNFGEIATVISGTTYLDGTGNGFSPDDTTLGGVTVNLLSGSTVVATTTSAANGTYAFAGYPLGTYTVSESAPAGDTITGPAYPTTYSVTTTAQAPASAGNNFDNYAPCTGNIQNITYTTSNWGTGTSLGGHTAPGATVSVTFDVIGSNAMVSLVSYVVPNPSNPALSQQVEYSLATGTFTPGYHTISVKLPTTAYQVDFVCGAAIDHFGPSGSNISYHGENRFFSSDTQGSAVCGNAVSYAPPLANLQSDIGPVGTPGTESYINGSYSLTASGADIWNNADALNYVYQALNGDGEIVARVGSITGSSLDPWAKAGVMIRQSLDAGSAQASVFATPGNGVVFQDRESQGAGSNSWSASNSYNCGASTPVYVKLVRAGTTLSAYDSPNGLNWSFIGSDTIALSQQVYVGLAATSHNNGTVDTATFDHVSTTGYWASSAGQSLINAFGGSSGSTCLSSALAQAYPNLYGSSAGADNLNGLSNAAVAAFAQSIEAACGPESLEVETLALAIDEFATSSYYGGPVAQGWGFNTGCYGIAGNNVNTAGACDAFGTSSGNSWTSVYNLLSAENNQATGGILYAGNSARHQGACNVITQVVNAGY